MKARIDMRGVLHIEPESSTEAFALRTWRLQAGVEIKLVHTPDTGYIRDFKLSISSCEKFDNSESEK